MTKPKPSPPIGRLLRAGQRRSGIPWLTIERDLDIRRATREMWMNGNVQRLPLIDVIRLCRYLGIKDQEAVHAAVDGKVPTWAHYWLGGTRE